MSDFTSQERYSTLRKPQLCQVCLRRIGAGEPARTYSGRGEDGMFRTYHHPECYAAQSDYAELHDKWGEDWQWLHDELAYDPDFVAAWMWRRHPLALRNIDPKTFNAYDDARRVDLEERAYE